MIFSSFVFNHYVVNVYFYCATNQGSEDLCHQSLIGGAGIFESEWHDFVTIKLYEVIKAVFSSSAGAIGI